MYHLKNLIRILKLCIFVGKYFYKHNVNKIFMERCEYLDAKMYSYSYLHNPRSVRDDHLRVVKSSRHNNNVIPRP